MHPRFSVAALGLVLALGLGIGPAVRAAAAQREPGPLTYRDAELLVLVTGPVLQEFNHGQAPVVGAQPGAPAQGFRDGSYFVQVRSQAQVLLGTYRVDARTAQVFAVNNGQELRGPELQAAQRILRESYGIAVPTPAAR